MRRTGVKTSHEGPSTKAVLVLGCPEVPVQTSIALYLLNVLKKKGIHPVIAGTKSARMLMDVADVDRHYLGDLIDLDQCVGEVAEKRLDFDIYFVFVHKDAGLSYAATFSSLSQGRVFAVVFGDHADTLASQITFPCETIVAKVAHNPGPLKTKIDAVISRL